jgi:hypothetical protein
MARYSVWLLAVLLFPISAGQSAPVKGPFAYSKMRVAAKGKMEFDEMFQGGRRACVIAVGDHNPVTDIAIEVQDEGKQIVAKDEGPDYAAAIWYPPRQAKYKIIVKNSGIEYNDMYLVFK